MGSLLSAHLEAGVRQKKEKKTKPKLKHGRSGSRWPVSRWSAPQVMTASFVAELDVASGWPKHFTQTNYMDRPYWKTCLGGVGCAASSRAETTAAAASASASAARYY
jgi:hypothetical protein